MTLTGCRVAVAENNLQRILDTYVIIFNCRRLHSPKDSRACQQLSSVSNIKWHAIKQSREKLGQTTREWITLDDKDNKYEKGDWAVKLIRGWILRWSKGKTLRASFSSRHLGEKARGRGREEEEKFSCFCYDRAGRYLHILRHCAMALKALDTDGSCLK